MSINVLLEDEANATPNPIFQQTELSFGMFLRVPSLVRVPSPASVYDPEPDMTLTHLMQ